jgi:hypothetical protein
LSVAWFFRVIETPHETWRCHWGKEDFDEHPSLSAAIEHITLLAAPHQPATLFVHWQDGAVTKYGAL